MMSADTKALGDWTCKQWAGSSNYVECNQILYRQDADNITMKYKRSDGVIIPHFTISIKKLEETPLDQALIHYVATLENKNAAIALLQQYTTERKKVKDEYKAPACLSEFFKDSPLEPLLGIPKADKLVAVKAVITWLETSKTENPTPELNLKPEHIKALTDKNLGDKIDEVRKLDKEFDSAFTAAITRSTLPAVNSFSVN